MGPSSPGLPCWRLPLFPRGVTESERQMGKLRPRGRRRSQSPWGHCLHVHSLLVSCAAWVGSVANLSSPEGGALCPPSLPHHWVTGHRKEMGAGAKRYRRSAWVAQGLILPPLGSSVLNLSPNVYMRTRVRQVGATHLIIQNGLTL